MTTLNNLVICDYPYAVEWQVEAPQQDNGVVCGNVDYFKLVITVSRGQHPLHERATFLHEIIHAIANHTGHAELRDNEDHTEALSYALVHVLRNNPELVKYLTE